MVQEESEVTVLDKMALEDPAKEEKGRARSKEKRGNFIKMILKKYETK